MDGLEYSRPFALSCDNTKLHEGLCPLCNHENKAFVIIGCAGEPQSVAIPNVATLESMVQSPEIVKATKVKAVVMTLPQYTNSCV